MASKIIGGIGSLLGIGGKKKTAATDTAATTAAAKGPIITPLGGASPKNKAVAQVRNGIVGQPTILSDKLGN